MVKAIVFDFDGVIVDSEPLHYRAFLRTVEPLGIRFSYEEYLETYIGYDDRDSFRVMMGRPPGKPGSPVEEAQIAELVERKADAFEAVCGEGVETFPGVVDFVRAAAGELPIAIASGATTRDIELILGGLKLRSHFGTIVTADHVERSKPDPQSYALAVEHLARRHPALRLEPEDCVAFEDTVAGIESARGAGLMTVGITNTAGADRLNRAHRVIEGMKGLSVAQLRAWFD
jgi:beta-phosphoglucomutase